MSKDKSLNTRSPRPTDPPQVQILPISSASLVIHIHVFLLSRCQNRFKQYSQWKVDKKYIKRMCERFGNKGCFCRFPVWKELKIELVGCYFSVFVLSVDCKCKQQTVHFMSNKVFKLASCLFLLLPVINKKPIAVIVYSAVLYTSSYINIKYIYDGVLEA